jgi:hypothetical protein
MGVHPAHLSDIRMIRVLGRDTDAAVIGSSTGGHLPSSSSSWPSLWWAMMARQAHTHVVRQRGQVGGFVQAVARPDRQSWDVARLCCKAVDQGLWTAACQDLLDHASFCAARRGAVRTFVRIASDSQHIGLLTASHYRPYATELSFYGSLNTLVGITLPTEIEIRPRLPRDAWDIFSLYSAVTPALVRHAEGRSLKEWLGSPRPTLPALRRFQAVRELVYGEPGMLGAWIRWTPLRKPKAQWLEILARPDAVAHLPQLLRYAVDHCGLDPNCTTICRTREYDGRISATLELAGFEPCARETLLVRHTVARVTERQLLVAALRAQGLGIDLSQYRRGVEAAHQRLVSSGGVGIHPYDRNDRESYY